MGKMGTRNSRSMREGKPKFWREKMLKFNKKLAVFEKRFDIIFSIQAVGIKTILRQF